MSDQVTPAEIKIMADMAKRGATMPEIAAATGRHSRTIKNHMDKLGIAVKNAVQRNTSDDMAAISQMVLSGMTARQIGARLGRSHSTIRSIVTDPALAARLKSNGLRNVGESQRQRAEKSEWVGARWTPPEGRCRLTTYSAADPASIAKLVSLTGVDPATLKVGEVIEA